MRGWIGAALVATSIIGARPARAEAPWALLIGRVHERGSRRMVAGAHVETEAGATATTDAHGEFQMQVTPGVVRLVVTAPGFEPLRRDERLVAGRGTLVEYRLIRRVEPYRTVVRSEDARPPPPSSLTGEAARTVPGSLGSPVQAVGALPGVLTPVPLLPAYVIRGGSPGTNGLYIDGMRVPQLFHALMGGSLVHPDLVERLDFRPGAYDASFGRTLGGVIDVTTRPGRGDRNHVEVDLRLLDAAVLAEVPLASGLRVALAGHYGAPGPLLRLVDPRLDVKYGDYLLRADYRGLTVEALGSYDAVSPNYGYTDAPELRVMFHRVQVRGAGTRGRVSLSGAVFGGLDELGDLVGNGVRKLSLGARGTLAARFRWFSISAGADGELSRFSTESFGKKEGETSFADEYGELGESRDGVVAGAWAMGTLRLGRWEATAGVRSDVHHAGSVTLWSVDPRLQVRVSLLPELVLSGGIGSYQQPPSFLLDLPGLNTFALALGLQRAVQGAVMIEARARSWFTLQLAGYSQRLWNATDIVTLIEPPACVTPPPRAVGGVLAKSVRQVDGLTYGMELLVRRDAGPVSGWISYTWSRSERIYSCGLRPSDFDQRHVLNVVITARLPWRLVASARLSFATGRPITLPELPDPRKTLRNNARLPDRVQLDLRIDRDWLFDTWALAAFIEVQNVTNSETVLGIAYPSGGTLSDWSMPPLNRFHWVLPWIGLRGRF